MVDYGLVLGHIKIDERTNEIKGMPELIEFLDLEEAIIPIDAIGCQKDITELLKAKGADFVISVKDNQRQLKEDIALELESRVSESINSGTLSIFK